MRPLLLIDGANETHSRRAAVGAVKEEISGTFTAPRQFQANDPISGCCVLAQQSFARLSRICIGRPLKR